MKRTTTYFALTIFSLTACNDNSNEETKNNSMPTVTTDSLTFKSGYSDVNGLKMYYEVYGEGNPLVLIHGGGSTIQSNFEKIIPLFTKNRQVIAVELQAHGRTSDRDADFRLNKMQTTFPHFSKT